MTRARAVGAFVVTVAMAMSLAACSDLMPTTSRTVASAPIVPPADAALVVFARPWPPDDVPNGGKWSYVRIVDDEERVLADLGYGDHAIVRASPGAHTFYAYNWASGAGDTAPCVGAMPATLAAARAYIAKIEEQPPPSLKRCRPIEIVRVPKVEHAAYWVWLRGSMRRELLVNRDKSIFLDAPWKAEWNVKKGRWRMADDPAWSAKASTLADEDGSPSIP